MSDILLIDDDQNFHDLFSAYAERLGCNTLHAFDGEEGERMALLHSPVLIILDIMMPGQDGYVTCKNLRERGYRGAISMTSSLHEATGTWKMHQAGANSYLMKPLDASILALHLEYARSDMKYPTVSEWLEHQ